MKTAVIVTTYNRPDALGAVLEGYNAQQEREFELIVADDGSTKETASVVEEFRDRATFPLQYVWQEDRGFRAAAIRNRAIASTKADYLIFTDGDCIPSRKFVKAHRQMAEAGCFLGGNRVLLAPAFTARILQEHIPIYRWHWASWVKAWFRREVNRVLPLLSLPDGVFRKWKTDRWEGIKTCNLSIWKNDLIRVNGLDESYQGWGLEDSDLVVRLLRAGVRHKSVRFAAPVFHLWHKEHDRGSLRDNQSRLNTLLSSSAIRAVAGLDQYDSL